MSQDPWKHRSEGMRCKTCMFFVPKVAVPKVAFKEPNNPSPEYVVQEGFYHLGRCRRHAPTMNGCPVVFVNDWCGDHKLDEGRL